MPEESVKTRLRGYFDEACKEMKIDSTAFTLQIEKDSQRFATSQISAELDGTVLHINEEWIENTLAENAEFDLMYIMYHEARHIYQHKVIADFEVRGKSSELPAVIASWKRDFSTYIRNEGDETSWMTNISQSVEIDANAFANVMLIKHGISARIAPGQEKIMKESIKHMTKKLWNVTIK